MRRLSVFDLETYPNYILIALKRIDDNVRKTFSFSDKMSKADKLALRSIMQRHTLVGYNSLNFDVPILNAVVFDNATASDVMMLVDYIIEENAQGCQTSRRFGISEPPFLDHIDLMMVNPSSAQRPSLKSLGARLHSKHLQDLPLPPGTWLTDEQKTIITKYCENDLDTTIDLYHELKPRLDLREKIGESWGGLDLRSKSDAQMAEAYMRKLYPRAKKNIPELPEGHIIRYVPPKHIEFQTPQLQRVLEIIKRRHFRLDEHGKIKFSNRFTRHTKTKIGDTTYKLGIGGLHSQEQKAYHRSEDKVLSIVDRDVKAFYPFLILNQGFAPKHLGVSFLKNYQGLVDRRIEAKKKIKSLQDKIERLENVNRNLCDLQLKEEKIVDSTIKILINGSFGKLASPYSVLYAPDLMLAVTLTGQLSLLMLIEAVHLAGLEVISANTDGFVTKVPREKKQVYDKICSEWEKKTGLELEDTYYTEIYSRDVNNYLAVTAGGELKQKGVFAHSGLMKSLSGDVIVDAAIAYLTEGKNIEGTIRSCNDVRRFLCDRRVTGGATWRGQELGKMVRWYYGTSGETIHYTENGNKVAKTAGAVPMMTLSETLPDDIDYDVYINETIKLLQGVGIDATI